MPKILMAVSPSLDSDNLAILFKNETGREPLRAGDGKEALAMAKEHSPDLVVVQERLPDMSYLEAVKELLMVNAFINTAVVTDIPADQFHEESEGLGILTGISSKAGPEAIKSLLEHLRSVSG